MCVCRLMKPKCFKLYILKTVKVTKEVPCGSAAHTQDKLKVGPEPNRVTVLLTKEMEEF